MPISCQFKANKAEIMESPLGKRAHNSHSFIFASFLRTCDDLGECGANGDYLLSGAYEVNYRIFLLSLRKT